MNSRVRVSAPARLHLGFLDLNGNTGRKFGSIGLAIDSHRVVVEMQLQLKTSIIGIDVSPALVQRANGIVEYFYTSLGKSVPIEQQGVLVELIELIPSHAGLGSGTQLAIAMSTALCKLHNISANTRDIAEQLGRGARSGIGIATFDQGGFIIDGGLGKSSTTPPLLTHYDFPQNWRVVLIMDNNSQGIHGEQELLAFENLAAFPLSDSQAICHHVLMKLLPAIIEQEIDLFGQAITDIQSLIGDHFAPAQGGRYTSQQVASLLNHAQKAGHTGIAQSSWGPTGCIFVESDAAANQLVSQLSHYAKQQTPEYRGLSFIITQANDHGADIVV
ncbi:MAG: beta-ribofuranosylaminobenzene 5'-phosphate synthase family protein [Methylophagaceae bacterium]